MHHARRSAFAFMLCALLAVGSSPVASQGTLEVTAIDKALGRTGSTMPGEVYRVSFPRSDLHVRVGTLTLAPGFALGSYAAFKAENETTLVVGDLALREGEIQRVMTSLENSGFRITALHNHLRNESPHVMYLHFMGTGPAATLAAGLRSALALTATPLGAQKTPDAAAPWFAPAIQSGIGYNGKSANRILSVSVPRAEAITMQGYALPPAMGVAIAMNFQDAGTNRVATTGDFVLIGSEVDAVEGALKAHGFELTALHHHMIGDSPPLYYMHFWSIQSPQAVASGLKAALAHINLQAR